MKEAELRQHAVCCLCDRPIGEAGQVFYRVRVEQYVVDVAAVQRQDGLTAMLGGSARLAQAMGDDQEMAHQMSDSAPFAVCLACASTPDRALPIAALLERGGQDATTTQENSE